jgi:photosystem II stability/assembly factor-like uncharacterized protein
MLHCKVFHAPRNKTTNGGLLWNKLTSGLPDPSDCEHFFLSKIIINPGDPSSLYVLSISCGIYKSTDSGGHWENILYRANTGFFSLFIDPGTSNIYVVAQDDSHNSMIYKSYDGGISWYVSHSDLLGMLSSLVLLPDPETPTTLYLGSDEGIFKSVNNGDWISMGKFSIFVQTLSIALSTPSVLHAGTNNGVYSLPLLA